MNGAPTTQAEQAVRKPEGLKTPELAADSQLESVFDAQGPSGLIEMGKQEIETVSKEIDMMSQPDPEAAPDAPAEVAELSTAQAQAKSGIDQAFQELQQTISTAEVPAAVPAPAIVEMAPPAPIPATEAAPITPEPAAVAPTAEVEAPSAEAPAMVEPQAAEAEVQEQVPPAVPEVAATQDWEGMISQEKTKLEAAKADYEEANRVYQDYVSKNPKPWTPIQQKYAKAMETQIAMDEAAWKQADNQIALYGASRDIEVLAKSPVEGSNTGAKLDALIADRNAKDAMTASLAAETEKMKTAHDAALADYMHQLDLVQGGESEEDAVVGGGSAVVERMPEAQTASRQAGSNAMPEAAPPKSPAKKPGLFGRLTGAIDKQVKKDLGAVVKPVSSMNPIGQAKQDTETLMGKSEQ